MPKEQPTGLTARKHERIRRLAEIWATGGYKTSKELAIRFDVTEQTICSNLKIAKAIVQDHFQETLAEDLDLRMLQLETLIEKGFRDHEKSRFKKEWCRLCDGKGVTKKEGIESDCVKCEGEGYMWEERPGDSKHLQLALSTIQEINKLKGHYPEKTKKVLEVVEVTKRFDGADPELVLQYKRALFLVDQSKNGHDNRDEPVDVEFEQSDEGEE